MEGGGSGTIKVLKSTINDLVPEMITGGGVVSGVGG